MADYAPETNVRARIWAAMIHRHCMEKSCNFAVLTDTKTTILIKISQDGGLGFSYVAAGDKGEGNEGVSLSIARVLICSAEEQTIIRDVLYEPPRAELRPPQNPYTKPLPPRDPDAPDPRTGFDDFDVDAMMEHRTLLDDFLAWKKKIDRLGQDEVIEVGTTLTGSPNGLLDKLEPFRSPFPDRKLPDATQARVNRLQRPRSSFLDEIVSLPFTFTIDEIVRKGPGMWAQVMFGTISPLDKANNTHISLPRVCVKLYDERFFNTPEHETGFDSDSDGLGWGVLPLRHPLEYSFREAATLARCEEAAYYSMRNVQGSFIPHCYGFHVVSVRHEQYVTHGPLIPHPVRV